MPLLENLKLSTGLICFGARPGMGVTRITLKIANQIAQNKKVLFISYQDYPEALESYIKDLEPKKAEKLILNTTFPYYEYGLFEDLKSLIQKEKAGVLIIDDLINFVPLNLSDEENVKDSIISKFKNLSDELDVQIILNLTVSRTVESRGGDHRPLIRDFRWSRKIINDCNQIYSIYRPAYYGMTQNEDGENLLDEIEISCLKNGKGVPFSLFLDNKEEGIIPVTQ